MAYATILVRFVYFISGAADKESWEGCHGPEFILIIFRELALKSLLHAGAPSNGFLGQ